MTDFIPKDTDLSWTRTLWTGLKIGGVWWTSWAVYKKIDKDTIAVVEDISEVYFKDEIEENISRVKIVCETIGLKFIDKRRKNDVESVQEESSKGI